jgi:Cu+-exporting ATPase
MRDPVCGMTVASDSEHRALHAGRDYRFCSTGCRKKFVTDPARYVSTESTSTLAAGVQAAVTTSTAGTTYTCPMHPEIIRAAPGNCPLCGMALEPVMPSIDSDEIPELADFRRRFWWTLPLSLSVFGLAMFGHRWPALSATARSWLELVLSAPVVFWAGWPFFVRWAQSIANHSPNMWTLIGTGVAAAFVYSVFATLAPGCSPIRSASTAGSACISRQRPSSCR